MPKKTAQKQPPQKHHLLLIVLGSVLLFGAALLITAIFPKKLSPVPPIAQPEQTVTTLDGTWRWQETAMNNDEVTTPNNPEAFNITFDQDGKLSISTDCNSGMSSYTTQESTLAIDAIATTLMYCEGSQEQVFLQQLAEVDTYMIDNNMLYLLLPMDTGTMTFVKQ